MNIKQNFPLIYAALWAVYNLQGLMGSFGPTIAVPILIINLLIGIYFFFYVNSHIQMSHFMKTVNVLMCMLVFYSLFYIFIDDNVYHTNFNTTVQKTNTLKLLLSNFLPLYVFYWATNKGYINKKSLLHFLILWSIYAILSYINYQQQVISMLMEKGEEVEEITNNMGMEFLTLIPFLILVDIKLLYRIIMVAFFFIMSMSSMKRGTLLIASIFLIIFINHFIKKTSRRNKIFTYLGIIALLFFLAEYTQDLFQNSSYMQARFYATLEGNSSGRDLIYYALWNHFLNEANIIQQLFGSGTDSTVAIVGNWAHNDWLEILTCQGIMGVLVFIFYFRGLYRDRNICDDSDIRIVLTMVLIMFLLKSIFSMSYPNISTCVLLGYCLAKLNDTEKEEA